MAKGKAKVNYMSRAGIVAHSDAPDWSFLYETSLVKDSKWNVGDRVVLPDGRVFRYAKATNIVNKIQYGLKFYGLNTDGIGYKAPLQTQAIGDVSVKVDAGKSVVVDSLRGGYCVFHTGGDNNDMSRGIIGNTASDADNYVTIYLDAPLTIALKTTYGVETHPNPYANVRLTYDTPNTYTSVAGMALIKTIAANQYLWLQTWGPIQGNPHGTPGKTANNRTVVFDGEGRIALEDSAVGANDMMQIAGFILDRTTAALHSGFIMLQVSP